MAWMKGALSISPTVPPVDFELVPLLFSPSRLLGPTQFYDTDIGLGTRLIDWNLGNLLDPVLNGIGDMGYPATVSMSRQERMH